MARNMMSNNTDMQDKYCGDCYGIHLSKATTKETTKEVARPKAAPPLLWWRPEAAPLVVALDRVNAIAVTTILVLRVCVIGLHVPRH